MCLCNNFKIEWGKEKMLNDEPSKKYDEDWCTEENYSVDNFSMHHKCLHVSRIRHDTELYLACAIVRK